MTGERKTHYEVIVVGAGVAGIYQIKRLVDLGIDATVLDSAADLGAPGTGTVILAAVLIPRATPTASRSRVNCSTSGTGKSGFPVSLRIYAISIMSPTSSIYASICSSTAKSRRCTSMKRAICGK